MLTTPTTNLQDAGIQTERSQKSINSSPLTIAGKTICSRLFLGTARYPNQQVMLDALEASGAEIVTVAIRRVKFGAESETIFDLLKERYFILPILLVATQRETPF